MPIRRFIGQSATAEGAATTTGVENAKAPETVAATVDDHVEEHHEGSEGNTEVVNGEGSNVTPSSSTSKIHSKFVNHLETYQVLGAVVEGTGEFLAPSILYAKSFAPDPVVSTIKTVDDFLDGILTRVDPTLPESLKRVPNHQKVGIAN